MSSMRTGHNHERGVAGEFPLTVFVCLACNSSKELIATAALEYCA